MRLHRINSFPVLAPYLLVVFFVTKAAITGIWIVRPWDVPDEVGHFSYIQDLATGKNLPVLHETLIDTEIWADFTREINTGPGLNWIAQHPPAYHLIMVPAYWVGSLFGESFWGSFYLIRLLTSVIFALGIWLLVKAFQEVGISITASLGLGIMIASIPNHTFLAGAVNHDALVFCCGSLVLLLLIRFTNKAESAYLKYLGLVLGFGGLVKYTFLVILPPVLLWIGIVCWMNKKQTIRSIGFFLGLVFVPLSLWMLRNWIVLGELLPVDTTGFHSDQTLNLSLLEFGQTYPILTILTRTYWGLLGWLGDGNLEVRWHQIYTLYQQAYTWPLIILMALAFWYLVVGKLKERSGLLFGVAGSIVTVLAFVLSGWWKFEQGFYQPFFFLCIAIVGWRLAEVCNYLRIRELKSVPLNDLAPVFVCLFFFLIHLSKIYSYSLSSGVLQGTFGRYYLLVVGFFVVGFLGKGARSFPYGAPLILGFSILYSSVELYVWLHEVIPFFYVHD